MIRERFQRWHRFQRWPRWCLEQNYLNSVGQAKMVVNNLLRCENISEVPPHSHFRYEGFSQRSVTDFEFMFDANFGSTATECQHAADAGEYNVTHLSLAHTASLNKSHAHVVGACGTNVDPKEELI